MVITGKPVPFTEVERNPVVTDLEQVLHLPNPYLFCDYFLLLRFSPLLFALQGGIPQCL